ncbi:MAG: YkgJ family cysteine cluster protein [Pseudomonadales bacterium]
MILPVARLEPSPEAPLAAGPFNGWLSAMSRALTHRTAIDVPCGDCTACCSGGYFVHVGPADAGARRRVPAALLFPAPGAPAGHRVLARRADGHCPMLRDRVCSIYEDRPMTCRTYDCRIFAATGLAEPEEEKRAIMARAARWRFDYADAAERARHDALRAVAWGLVSEAEGLADVLPRNATQLAMLVVERAEPLLALLEAAGGRLPEVGRLRPVLAADPT